MITRIVLGILMTLFVIAPISAQLNCENDSTGLVPLVDLQEGFYEGYQGGLYPGGSNYMPSAHKEEGKNIARKVVPLDSAGNVDWENGKIVFLGMGASVAGNPWNHLIAIAKDEPDLNPCMQLINGCVGSKGLDIMVDLEEHSDYWTDDVIPRIENKGYTQNQVQAIWIKHAYKRKDNMTFPEFPDTLVTLYKELIPILMDTFPNLKLMFLSGFTYGGYADSTYNFYHVVVEPGSYWTNFSVKWLIEEQINLNPQLKYTGGGRNAPWMAWGPHVWSDGVNPNQWDSLTWHCKEDYGAEGGGYHLSYTGRQKESGMLLEWARNHPAVKGWFLDGPRWKSCDGTGRMSSGESFSTDEMDAAAEWNLYPSPNNGVFNIRVGSVQGTADLRVVNALGSTVWQKTGQDPLTSGNLNVDLGKVAPGIYYLLINDEQGTETIDFIVK